MRFLFELVPLVIFFIVLLKFDIYIATQVLMVALTIQVIAMWAWFKKVEKIHLITLALVLILGGFTIAFENPLFIKWKPTIANWLFAVGFMLAQFFTQKPLIQYLMGEKVQLPDSVWKKLNWSWVVFFIIMGGLNLFVAYSFSTVIWAQFKVFGILGLTLVFVIVQGVYLSKHLEPDETHE